MKKIALAAIAALTLGLSGCGFSAAPAGTISAVTSTTTAETVTEAVTVDGVPCIVLFDGTSLNRNAVAITCDWDSGAQ